MKLHATATKHKCQIAITNNGTVIKINENEMTPNEMAIGIADIAMNINEIGLDINQPTRQNNDMAM